jgi:hypothetical protein
MQQTLLHVFHIACVKRIQRHIFFVFISVILDATSKRKDSRYSRVRDVFIISLAAGIFNNSYVYFLCVFLSHDMFFLKHFHDVLFSAYVSFVECLSF